jgi:hypothetical protein
MNVEIIPKTKAEILQEKQREYVRKNYYKNKEKKLKSIMEHRRLNPEKYREYHRLYYHRKLKKVKTLDADAYEELNLLEIKNT